MDALFPALFRACSHWPLWLLHGLGSALGWLTFLASPSYRRELLANSRQAGYRFGQIAGAVAQAGQMVAELPRLWLGPPVPYEWGDVSVIDEAIASGRGVLYLTPHLGCFEITGQALAERYGAARPVTALYRPPRQPWLRPLVERARDRPGLRLVPTSLSGVKQLLKALKAGEAVALLPDQVPPQGLGQWTPFFGRDAYTMTLSARLALQSGAVVVLTWGERLPRGRGYRLHFSALPKALPADLADATLCVNQAMESLIRQCPRQYLWGYGRYKQPRRTL